MLFRFWLGDNAYFRRANLKERILAIFFPKRYIIFSPSLCKDLEKKRRLNEEKKGKLSAKEQTDTQRKTK